MKKALYKIVVSVLLSLTIVCIVPFSSNNLSFDNKDRLLEVNTISADSFPVVAKRNTVGLATLLMGQTMQEMVALKGSFDVAFSEMSNYMSLYAESLGLTFEQAWPIIDAEFTVLQDQTIVISDTVRTLINNFVGWLKLYLIENVLESSTGSTDTSSENPIVKTIGGSYYLGSDNNKYFVPTVNSNPITNPSGTVVNLPLNPINFTWSSGSWSQSFTIGNRVINTAYNTSPRWMIQFNGTGGLFYCDTTPIGWGVYKYNSQFYPYVVGSNGKVGYVSNSSDIYNLGSSVGSNPSASLVIDGVANVINSIPLDSDDSGNSTLKIVSSETELSFNDYDSLLADIRKLFDNDDSYSIEYPNYSDEPSYEPSLPSEFGSLTEFFDNNFDSSNFVCTDLTSCMLEGVEQVSSDLTTTYTLNNEIKSFTIFCLSFGLIIVAIGVWRTKK